MNNLTFKNNINTLILLLMLFSCASTKDYEVKYLSSKDSEEDLRKLYDSLMVPLMVYNKTVYALNPECIPRNSGANANDRNQGGNANDRNQGGNANDRNQGGNANDRNQGGNANDRNQGGNANDRNQGGNANDRNQGGNANDRNQGGNANDRNQGGNANDRNQGGNANDRNFGGKFSEFTCSTDSRGIITIIFHKIDVDQDVKIYYNYRLFTSKDKLFKLKKV